MTPRKSLDVRLVLDEMHAPVVAQCLREREHNVVSVAEDHNLRAMDDAALFRWAVAEGRWIVTENIKDFRRILRGVEELGQPRTGLLFTSSRTFPRSRHNPGTLIAALEAWLTQYGSTTPPTEDWLRLATPR